MTDSIKQKLCKVLELCVDITELGCDCFFDYCGHVNYYNVYHCNGKYKGNLFDVIPIGQANDINLDQTIQKLEALKTEWSNKK